MVQGAGKRRLVHKQPFFFLSDTYLNRIVWLISNALVEADGHNVDIDNDRFLHLDETYIVSVMPAYASVQRVWYYVCHLQQYPYML